MSSNDESDQRLDPESLWPELFAPLTADERHNIVQTLAIHWHAGWTPDAHDVRNLIDVVQGKIDKAEYDRRTGVRIYAKELLKDMIGHDPEDPTAKREAEEKRQREVQTATQDATKKAMAKFDKYEEEHEKYFDKYYEEELEKLRQQTVIARIAKFFRRHLPWCKDQSQK